MTEITSAYDSRGRVLIDENGEKIGKIEELYGAHQIDTPEWASVHTGLVGTQRSFVPLAGATPRGEDVQVPVSRKQVNDAPSVEPDEELSERKEIELFQHYGVQHPAQGSVTAEGAGRAAVAESEGPAAQGPPRTPVTQSRGRATATSAR